MKGGQGWRRRPFWIRLFHWEYWSFNVIYIPIYPVFIFLCLRARSFFFFAASNPGIKNGGFLGESKKEIYGLMPESFQPKTIFFNSDEEPVAVLEKLLLSGFHFPVIGKPDIGGRGRGVRKLENPDEVIAYTGSALFDFHIQEFIPYKKEVGIFYYRFPGQLRGNISGIVHKEFLKVTGDGSHSVRDLLKSNPRGVLQLASLESSDPGLLDRIIPAGDDFIVVPYGNHARGALFLDDTDSVTPALITAMDMICKQIKEFYFGRLDIRYESRKLLEQGKFFSVIEVNGAGSEPTHIYDPKHSLFFGWKEIIRHWILLFKISRANHRLGHPYLSFSEGVHMFRKDKSDSKILSELNKITS